MNPTKHSITIAELAVIAGVHPRTLARRQEELGLSRLPRCNRKGVYQFVGPLEALVRQIKYPYRRAGSVRISHVPDPAFVSEFVTRQCGQQPEVVIEGCVLTLAKLAEMSLILGNEAGIQINAALHQRLVGSRHHKKILHILTKTRLIEKVDGYEVGKCCNSYRLTDASMSRLEEHSLWWPAVSQCQEKQGFHGKLVHDTCCPHDPAVLLRLKEDSKAFAFPEILDMEAICSEQAEAAIKKAMSKRRSLSTEAREAIIKRSRSACIAAHRRYVADPLSLFHLGAESQRIFHPIAVMPHRLRTRLCCLGGLVTVLDIRCCQPFLLGIILMRDHQWGEIPQDELDRFMDLCQRGEFYSYVGDRLTPPITRDSTKRICYRDLLFGHEHSHRTRIVKLFNEHFPAMGRALHGLRGSSRSLAQELQRSESGLIIGHVLPALQKAFPNHPITNVHDAILLPRSIATEAKALFAQTARKATGRQVGIKVESP